jgi:hypothetical protein
VIYDLLTSGKVKTTTPSSKGTTSQNRTTSHTTRPKTSTTLPTRSTTHHGKGKMLFENSFSVHFLFYVKFKPFLAKDFAFNDIFSFKYLQSFDVLQEQTDSTLTQCLVVISTDVSIILLFITSVQVTCTTIPNCNSVTGQTTWTVKTTRTFEIEYLTADTFRFCFYCL